MPIGPTEPDPRVQLDLSAEQSELVREVLDAEYERLRPLAARGWLNGAGERRIRAVHLTLVRVLEAQARAAATARGKPPR